MSSPNNTVTDEDVANARYWAIYSQARTVAHGKQGEFLLSLLDNHDDLRHAKNGKEPAQEAATPSGSTTAQNLDLVQSDDSHPTASTDAVSEGGFARYSNGVSPLVSLPVSPKRSADGLPFTPSPKRHHAKLPRSKYSKTETHSEDTKHQIRGIIVEGMEETQGEESQVAKAKQRSQSIGQTDPMSIHALLVQAKPSPG